MNEETTFTSETIQGIVLPKSSDATPVIAAESAFWGVSVRAWIAFVLVDTVCAMSFMHIPVDQPLNSMALLAIGFYFGQSKK